MASLRRAVVKRRVGGFVVAVGVGAAIASGATGAAWANEDGKSTEAAAASTGPAKNSTAVAGEDEDRRTRADADGPRRGTEPAASADPRTSPDGNTEAGEGETEAAGDDGESRILASGRHSTKLSDRSLSRHTRSLEVGIAPPVGPAGDVTDDPAAAPTPTDLTGPGVISAARTNSVPEAPAATPALWSLLGAAPREQYSVSTDQPVPPVTTSEVPAGQANPPVSETTAIAAVQEPPEWESLYTGEPSWFHNVVTAGLNVLKVVFKPFGGLLRYTSLRIPIFTDGIPPFFVRPGLDVERTEFEGMKVWSLTARGGFTEKVVVALHGGSYEGQVNLFQWSTYAVMARDTGATVVVPLYALAPKGTAAAEVPRTANFIAKLIDGHGAENVSVLGDSAGGGLALAALQELARRNVRQPSRLVLMAPWLDVSMSDPRSAEIRDPLLDIPNLARPGAQWAGSAGTADPMASPLFGSLEGLPPTFVYSSSRDLLTVDTLRLRDRVLAEGVPGFTFRLRAGLIHDWFIFPFLPDARAERPNVYADLLGPQGPIRRARAS